MKSYCCCYCIIPKKPFLKGNLSLISKLAIISWQDASVTQWEVLHSDGAHRRKHKTAHTWCLCCTFSNNYLFSSLNLFPCFDICPFSLLLGNNTTSVSSLVCFLGCTRRNNRQVPWGEFRVASYCDPIWAAVIFNEGVGMGFGRCRVSSQTEPFDYRPHHAALQ